MKPLAKLAWIFLLFICWGPYTQALEGSDLPVIKVGSKNFTEGYLLAEIIAQEIEGSGLARVERRFGLGGTGIVAEGLAAGSIDLYPEYTGTISEVLLKNEARTDLASLQLALAARRFIVSESLGFDNTYALAVRSDFAKEHKLKNISDLAGVVGRLRLGFTYEFMARRDGYEALRRSYDLKIKPEQVQRMEHALIFTAISQQDIDVAEVYSTDAKVHTLDLVLLEDDRKFFPSYEAVILARQDFTLRYPEIWQVLKEKLEGRLSLPLMRQMNARVDLDKVSFANAVKQEWSQGSGDLPTLSERHPWSEIAARVLRRVKEHLWLVGISLFFSLLIGLPLGILASALPRLGQVILVVSGLLQTIPSLALLSFLIPLVGIGAVPALIALFLYGLLPIVLNTHTGLSSLDPRFKEMSFVLGLTKKQRLYYIDLPLASPQILVGIKTSAIVGIGTATLAALIGAGGLGAPIITGLALNDQQMILTGAAPAAALALLVHVLFEFLQRWLIPRGLRR